MVILLYFLLDKGVFDLLLLFKEEEEDDDTKVVCGEEEFSDGTFFLGAAPLIICRAL